jgi:hypothetical protein
VTFFKRFSKWSARGQIGEDSSKGSKMDKRTKQNNLTSSNSNRAQSQTKNAKEKTG